MQVSPAGQPLLEKISQPRDEQVPPPEAASVRHTGRWPVQSSSESHAAPTLPATYVVGQGELEPQPPPPRRPPFGPRSGDQLSTSLPTQVAGTVSSCMSPPIM